MIRRYSELIKLSTFEDRFNYLKLNSKVGYETFGFDRWLNQMFYRSRNWASVRREIILRDYGCDLGVKGYDICGKIIVHHMNPVGVSDIVDVTDYLLDPDYLISVSMDTHNAIHYGDASLTNLVPVYPITRKPNDTCPWK